MSKLIIGLIAVFVSACSQNYITSGDIKIAEDLCKDRGGYTQISRFNLPDILKVVCKDGVALRMSPTN
jgi:hypothetical protein